MKFGLGAEQCVSQYAMKLLQIALKFASPNVNVIKDLFVMITENALHGKNAIKIMSVPKMKYGMISSKLALNG